MVIFNGEPKKQIGVESEEELVRSVRLSVIVDFFLRIKEIVCCTLHGSSSALVCYKY